MTELKTLKDMPEALSTVEHPFKEWVTWSFIEGILKQEAIKWVKDFDEKNDYCKNEMWRVNFLKFHNITEEDLE